MRRSDTLSPKNARVAAAILATPSARDAATTAGVSKATIFRRLRDVAFRRELDRMAEASFGAALASLREAAGEATATLRAIVQTGKPGEQRKAATAIISLGLRARELGLERRITALEERLGPDA
jgi:DNA-binding MurR/RpiR family transcriptional regulator